MIYAYRCSCGHACDVIKPVSDYRRAEFCPKCNAEMTKAVAPSRLYFNGSKVQDKVFNPAFGKAVTDAEARALAKERGWEEVGNESLSHIKPPELELPDFNEEDIKSLTPEKIASLP